jgi:hypothetical protein
MAELKQYKKNDVTFSIQNPAPDSKRQTIPKKKLDDYEDETEDPSNQIAQKHRKVIGEVQNGMIIKACLY